MKKPNPDKIIAALGGTGATARFFEIEPGSVSDWRRKGIPDARLRHLRDIRPDLFQEKVKRPGA